MRLSHGTDSLAYPVLWLRRHRSCPTTKLVSIFGSHKVIGKRRWRRVNGKLVILRVRTLLFLRLLVIRYPVSSCTGSLGLLSTLVDVEKLFLVRQRHPEVTTGRCRVSYSWILHPATHKILPLLGLIIWVARHLQLWLWFSCLTFAYIFHLIWPTEPGVPCISLPIPSDCVLGSAQPH